MNKNEMIIGKLLLLIDSDILWFVPQFSAYALLVVLIIMSVKLGVNSGSNGKLKQAHGLPCSGTLPKSGLGNFYRARDTFPSTMVH